MLKTVLFYKLEHLLAGPVGKSFRALGQSVFKSGQKVGGEMNQDDQLPPSLRAVALSDKVYPKLLDADWVAPNATVVGDVEAGAGVSLWHGVVIRGDKAKIQIGKNTIVQDNALVTADSKDLSKTVVIGDNVFIGANATIREAELESYAYVGPGASVAKGALVEGYGMVAAGAQVAEGTVVPSGQVFAGTPAKYL